MGLSQDGWDGEDGWDVDGVADGKRWEEGGTRWVKLYERGEDRGGVRVGPNGGAVKLVFGSAA